MFHVHEQRLQPIDHRDRVRSFGVALSFLGSSLLRSVAQ